ncbi:alpha/beta fold hydrolase [Myxococcus sp. RHSTA-1-4]|uniref:alpha/beta fold hydrolase n=1 Tax=Myxococcus sp. RHSTA-1-4 TaxID=2874601 RepID=UPI001CBC15B9|nr:alpha/beta hydrolase [Myxococcus sp. RHSTA-1-4]MBZ4419877.1 alpha/beta hydrolase [Myxococcus sp. RHSTA-1-4]
MPFLSIRGAQLYYEDSGGSGEPVVFSHGLLWDSHLFSRQVEALKGRYRCIRYDHRGQGRSEAPEDGRPIDLRTVYEDAVAFIQALKLAPCHFVGLSMGGFVGLRVAARHPELLRSLVLLDTSASAELPGNLTRYRLLAAVTHWLGLWPVVDRIMRIYFGPTFMNDPARRAEREALRRQLASNPRAVWRAMDGVINRRSVEGELHRILTPTLILVGEEDAVTLPEMADRLHERIAGSRLVRLPHGGHMSNLEQPEAVNAAISAFLDEVPEEQLQAV